MTASTALTRGQVAERLGVSVKTLDRLLRRHPVPILKVGRLIRFDDHAITYLREVVCRSTSAAEPTPAPSISSAAFVRPVPPRVSSLDAALQLTTPSSRAKRPRRSRPNTSAPCGTESELPRA